MCQQWLKQLGIVSLSLLLFGCALNPSGTGAVADFSLVKNIRHHVAVRGPNDASDPENAATQDYYDSQTSSADEEGDNNLWVAIRENFKINHYANNPEVRAQIAWFVHNQGYLDRTALRAAPFMYYIYQEVKVRHLPSELVLLPIIESAYNPFVSSYAGAVGLWQLVPGTARTFGVRQDWWYDGRRDITASTKAALDYFTYLHTYFDGNWLLAIAAYNSGEGTVSFAIHRNAREGLNTDFWALRLPAQTESYVPRLLALAVIVNNPGAFGVHLPPISNRPYLGQVEISSQITLAKAAQLAGMSLIELKILNSGYKENTLSPNQPYKLLLPIDRISLFRQNLLGQSSNGNTGLMSHYKVQPGDTWQKIAQRFHTTTEVLKAINHTENLAPTVDEILLIPENNTNQAAIAKEIMQQPASPFSTTTQDAEKAFTAASPNMSETVALDKSAMQESEEHPWHATTLEHEEEHRSLSHDRPNLYQIIHTVRPDETLYSIARLYSISDIELARWNRLSEHAVLKPGMKLHIFQRNPLIAHPDIQEKREIPVRHPEEHSRRGKHEEPVKHTKYISRYREPIEHPHDSEHPKYIDVHRKIIRKPLYYKEAPHHIIHPTHRERR